MTVHQQRGRYLDELEIGDIWQHRPGRTVTEADNLLFSALTMNRHSLHFDTEYAAATPFGERLVNSIFTLGVIVGLAVAELSEGTSVANLGFGDITFPNPVVVGDTLYAETQVVDKRPSRSRPSEGIVTYEHRGRRQDGELVCVATRTALVRCDPAR